MEEKSGKVAKNAGNRCGARDCEVFKSGQKVAKWPEKVAKNVRALLAELPLVRKKWSGVHFAEQKRPKYSQPSDLLLPEVGADFGRKNGPNPL